MREKHHRTCRRHQDAVGHARATGESLLRSHGGSGDDDEEADANACLAERENPHASAEDGDGGNHRPQRHGLAQKRQRSEGVGLDLGADPLGDASLRVPLRRFPCVDAAIVSLATGGDCPKAACQTPRELQEMMAPSTEEPNHLRKLKQRDGQPAKQHRRVPERRCLYPGGTVTVRCTRRHIACHAARRARGMDASIYGR
mmetsp:Transcript_1005/g.2565  ORF Transcript_1005/g.2565 Transcript_1005/m.2565 type:complete len:200 (+) Transcript_1005:1117-1716(+)